MHVDHRVEVVIKENHRKRAANRGDDANFWASSLSLVWTQEFSSGSSKQPREMDY